MSVEKLKRTELMNKVASLQMWGQVRTPNGTGILIGIETPGNGLYYEPERADFLVWYGMDNEHAEWVGNEDTSGIYISRWYKLDELKSI